MKKYLPKLFLVSFLTLGICFYGHAQTDPGDPGGDPELPLDPGSWVLVVAGVGYGVKKWRDTRKQNEKDINGEGKDIKCTKQQGTEY